MYEVQPVSEVCMDHWVFQDDHLQKGAYKYALYSPWYNIHTASTNQRIPMDQDGSIPHVRWVYQTPCYVQSGHAIVE
jgi:hypothetical protein